jgi:hypothetical protein
MFSFTQLAQAIKAERWEDAKNIQALIQKMEPPPPKVAISQTTQPSTHSQANAEECARANQDYEQALATYNAEKSSRSSSRLVEAVGILGMLSPIAKNQTLGALYSGAGRNSATDSQSDMDHALLQMQDAQRRMALFCKE